MSVSLRATGTWAELIADGSVAIPATPQAGDRMYLFARWKDFSVTATVTNWTAVPGTPFADGSVSAGNGTGSVKVACWYRDWQPGDTDPTIDFSASPDNASAVIMVMQKGPDDVWLTPVAVTAAMTTWTTSSQSVSASATVDVPSSSVVMGLIGIRDDTATMTRPTNGIDDSGGLVTWNGNYVESPATHHSTTTGFDGAADLGYRLVTTGAADATLRMTGTISAAETGAALWVVQGVSVQVTPGNASLTSSQFAPQLQLAVTPTNASLVSSTFAPQLRLVITPATAVLTLTLLTPLTGLGLVPAPATLSTATFTPTINLQITPPAATLAITSFAVQLQESLTPVSATLSATGFAPAINFGVIPTAASLTLNTFAPTVAQNILITVPNTSLTLTSNPPHVLPFNVIYLDPGGDAVHAAGYFHTNVIGSGSDITYDPTVQVAGAGSYRFDSNTNEDPTAEIPDVLGASRRGSFYWRYDSVPDRIETTSSLCRGDAVYSGGGFDALTGMDNDDGTYATATPARNAGQGSRTDPTNSGYRPPAGAVIDSVKIIYERKYDVNTSIGISRVKWVVNGEEGPNHDNTEMPLTDTVVEVDVTADRAWEWQDFQPGVFKIIAEARRGDTDTEHTQSWDYVKVELAWHLATAIVGPPKAGGEWGFQIAVTPKGSHVVVRFVDGAGVSYDGITTLAINTQNRISFGYVYHGVDDLDINVFVNGIPELSIEEASTGGATLSPDLHYGWLRTPGVDHLCWFSHLRIDSGDDLQDMGNDLLTAKRSAAVNENNWNTTGGTGAVNERPLSETNYIAEVDGIARLRQSYTLEAANAGDVDLTGEILRGYMGWAWAKLSAAGEPADLIVNNVLVDQSGRFTGGGTIPLLLTVAVVDAAYPSHAAGIGMRNAPELVSTFMYECGAIIAYQGPANPDILLPRQEVANETLDTIIDDLRADPPDSYEVCCQFPEFDGTVEIIAHSLDQDGGSVSYQGTLNSNGRMRISPGVEVYLDVTITGVTMLQIWRRLNVD